MTGYAQVKGQAGQESAPVNFSLSLKAVNHRFLDLNMRLPAESDALEMKLRSVQEALELVLDVARERRLIVLEVVVVILIGLELLLGLTRLVH